MAAEITRPDLISQDALTAFTELAQTIDHSTASLTKLIATGKESGIAIKAANSTKALGDETKNLKVAKTELEKIEKQIAVANERANKSYEDQVKKLQSLKQEQKERLALGGKEAKLINEQNASIKQLEAALNKNRAAYKALSDEEARNSKEGKELKAVIDQQDAAVKKLNGGLGDFTDNVGNYEGAMKGLKNELKLAKDEMAFLAKNTGTTSPEFVKAAAKAGDLKDQISDLNDQIKLTAGGKFEVLGASLKDVGSKLLSLDFDGAANSAKQFAAVSKTLSFKEVAEGLKSFGTTLATVGKAILTNPLFIMVGVITAVALAFKYFRDEQEKASSRAVERYGRELEALTTRYDTEIRLQKIVGNQTFALEKAKQQAIIDSSKKSIKAIGDVAKFDLLQSLVQRRYIETLNEDKLKQLGDFTKASRDAANELKIIAAEESEFERKTFADLYEKKKQDIFALESFRLKGAIEAQQQIADSENNGYDKRIQAVTKYTKIKNKLARLEYDDAISQANLTAEAILLIEEELQKKIADNKSVAIKSTQEINDQLNKSIQENIKKAGNAVDANVKRNIKGFDETGEAAKRLESNMGVTFKRIGDYASYQIGQLRDKLVEGIQEIQDTFNMFAGNLGQLFANISAKRIQELDAESQANEDKLNKDLLLAGDNEAAKDRLRLQAEKKELELEKRKRAEARKSAQINKILALAEAVINTALGISKAIPTVPLMILAGAAGALQIAAIASQPIPSYFKGTDNHPGGLAQVGEKGTELMRSPSGDYSFTPSYATVMDLPRGTKVFNNADTMRMLAMGALQQNGGSAQQSNRDPELLNEVKLLNQNIKNIKPAKSHSLVRSGAVIYEAMKDAQGNINLRRSINLGKWL